MTPAPARQPIFNIPRTIVMLIAAMAALHGARWALPEVIDDDVLAHLAFVPARLTALVDPSGVAARMAALAVDDPGGDGPAAVASFFFGTGSPQPWTLVSYAALHGGWTHLGLNAIWLVVFGTPVARRLGPVRFLAFFVASAVAGALAHLVSDPFSPQPLIGASAAVSGCMGAAVRFMFDRRRDDTTDRWSNAQATRRSVVWALTDRRAASFLAFWFVSNLVTGLWAVPLGLSDMPIAWQAHVGGLLFGLLGFAVFDPVQQASAPAGSDLPARPDDPAR